MNNRKRKARPVRVILAALMLCMGALLLPVTAYAQSDTTPPTITAEVSGETLTVAASDDVSGVAAILVDGNRITTLVNGGATVNLKDYAGTSQKISVYAVDNAGNKSETVKFDNPYYQAPVQLQTASEPAAPSSSSSAAASSSSSPSSSNTASSSAPASSSSSSSASSTESAVPESGSGTLTPDGTGTVQDNATDEDGKEFFTITTADGTVYYLVIDRQRGTENVYFLDTVKPEDLLALAESGGTSGETAIPTPTEPEPAPSTSDPGEETDPEPEQEGGGMGTILFVVLAVAAAGGAGWYFKIYRPKQQASMDDDFDDLEDFDDSDDGGEYDGPALGVASAFDLDDETGRDEYEQDDGSEYDPAGDGE